MGLDDPQLESVLEQLLSSVIVRFVSGEARDEGSTGRKPLRLEL